MAAVVGTALVGEGKPGLDLGREGVEEILSRGIPEALVRGKRVLVLTPDTTRTCPRCILTIP